MSLASDSGPIVQQAELEYAKTVEARKRVLASGNGARLAGLATLAADPEPLRRPVPQAAEYPADALGDLLGPAARRIHEVVKAPLALCGQSVLAAASLAAQAHADVVIDGRRELLSLWAVTIAESGERKSAADRIALEAHREHERQAAERFTQAEAAYKAKLTAHKAASSAATKGKAKSLEAIEAELRKLGAEPEMPLQPWLIVGAPTIEGVHRLYRDGQPSLGLFHDDGGEFIGGHAMNKDNRVKSAAGMSRLWDCGEFDRVRGGDGSAKYFGRRLALHLMLQPVIAETVLSDDVLTRQGFLARTLLAWPESKIGTRRYAEVDLSADQELARYRARIIELLTRPPNLHGKNELEPVSLTLASDAKALWIAVHDSIEPDMKDGGEFASVRAWASKAPAQCLRIAGVLTLLSDPDSSVIHAEAINQGATLMLYALGEAVRIVGTAAVPVEIRHAEALLNWCHGERRELLYSGAALQFGPAAIRTRSAFDAAIAELERAGWANSIAGGCEVEGVRRRRAWAIRGAS